MRLRLTCKKWYQAIYSDPKFWNLLSNREPVAAWNKILRLNPSGPICMSYAGSDVSLGLGGMGVLPTMDYFLEVAIKEVARLQSCRFMVPGEPLEVDSYEVKLVEKLLSLKAPLLEEVVIDHCVSDGKMASFDLFGGFAPCLNHISFSYAPDSLWTSPTLRNLTTIDVNKGELLAMETLFTRVLPLSLNLVHLWIQCEMVSDSHRTIPDSPQLTLPALKTLHIVAISNNTLAYILAIIQIPSIDWLSLERIGYGFSDNSSRNLCRIIGATVSAAALRAKHPLQVRIWQNELTIGSKLFRFEEKGFEGFSNTARILAHLPSGLLNCRTHLSLEHDIKHRFVSEILRAAHTVFYRTTRLYIPSSFSLDWVQVLAASQMFLDLNALVILGHPPSADLLRSVASLARSHSALKTIHISKHSPRDTSNFQVVCEEYKGVVVIQTDAPEL